LIASWCRSTLIEKLLATGLPVDAAAIAGIMRRQTFRLFEEAPVAAARINIRETV
jgi:hypothetical protein